jgi:kynurenine formamidase
MIRVVDLSLPLRAGLRGFEKRPQNVAECDRFNTSMLHVYSHCGTHMDAQIHFAAGPETIDEHPPERCMGMAWIIDVAGVGPRTSIGLSHLRDLPNRFRAGESLLLRTGWSRHVADASLYRDQLPRVSEELAQWCVDHRVKILGVEPPSVADVGNIEELISIHTILLKGKVTIVEGLANLDELTNERCFFIALPLGIEGGDGSPVRAIALEGDDVLESMASRFQT